MQRAHSTSSMQRAGGEISLDPSARRLSVPTTISENEISFLPKSNKHRKSSITSSVEPEKRQKPTNQTECETEKRTFRLRDRLRYHVKRGSAIAFGHSPNSGSTSGEKGNTNITRL
ncbi:hypothetical protein AB6A40_011664 [Gnathostoma spinigerum]|uniref:Uncharacterized protein n=1 Tax=Gnathostoma spinigerum TaxID=75299 RepID=A0ABD6EZL1_9BILA